MKKIFLDANIIVDFLDGSSKYHQSTLTLIMELKKQNVSLFISPATFIIANHLVYKYTRNRSDANKKLKALLKYFKFTTEDHKVMEEVVASKFDDLEDAVQYFSAMTISPDFIITHNNVDFSKKDKRVLNFHYMVGLIRNFSS
jgi:predicted nucleic acid-binding protein